MTAPQAVRASSAVNTDSGLSQPTTVDLAVVIPAFNEWEAVGATVDRVRAALARSPFSFDLVVVDDGSTDETGEQARMRGARVVTLGVNQGYGGALKAGILASASEHVAIIDADGTYPPEAIPHLMALASGVDMVVGARAASDSSIPWRRRPAKRLIAWLGSYLVGQAIPDINSGLRLMRRSVLMHFFHLLPQGFSFTTTITLALLSTGRPVIFEPIVCQPRIGSSKLRAADFSSFVMLVLRTVVLFNPLRVFLPLGAVLFLIGFGKFIYDLFLWNLSETAVMGFLSAIVVWSVGLLADMIARLQLRPPPP